MNRSLTALIAVVAAVTIVGSAGNVGAASDPPTVLFMCPHGAAKSVLASAYFQKLAKERGLRVRVMSAGTEPDREVAPAVARHLAETGHEVPTRRPRRATAEDMATADVVISIGCDLTNLPPPRGTLVNWNDVPPLSDDFSAADARIRARVRELADQLVQKWPR